MNTTSNRELEDFEKSKAPERFELKAPSNNSLLPVTNASVSKRDDHSVEVDWSKHLSDSTTASIDNVLKGIELSVRRSTLRFPQSARAHANLGAALLKSGQTKEANEELRTALEIDPGNYLAGLTMARLHLSEGNVEDAEARYRNLLKFYPDAPPVKVGLSIVLIRKGQFDEARMHLSDLVGIDKQNSFAHFLLGLVCLQKSDLRCALNAFRTASNSDFRNPDIHHAIGVVYTLQGDSARAEKAFKTAFSLAPDSPGTVISLARTILSFKESDQAIEILQAFLELHPDNLEARDQLAAGYMQAERYLAVRSQISQILERGEGKLSHEEIARHHTNIAVSFMYERKFERARVELELAIAEAPKASNIPYDNLARVYAHTNKPGPGIAVLRRALELFPKSRETRSILSSLYAEIEDYWGAITELEILRTEGALSDENYASLSAFYGEMEVNDRALEVLVEGYAKYPKSMSIINNLAYFLLEKDRIAEAKEVLNSRPKNEDVRVEMTATLGLLQLKSGNYQAARRLYKHAESMASKSSRRELARRVRQKMHLELARFHVKRGDSNAALREIRAGLQEKVERQSFVRFLERLASSLQESRQ